jgi:DNA-directed RNA polymerase subunit RPC12/RpoP
MSEFKFICPACGKSIKCESWRRNSMMECPMCFQRVVVPQAPAGDKVELVIKGSKATRRLVTKPETNLGRPPVPTPPAKAFPVAGIAFVILLCAVIAAAFVFGGKIFKSTGDQTSQVTSASNEKKMPQPVVPHKPIGGLVSVIFAKGDSMVLESGTAAAEVKDPARAAFLAAFTADLAHPLAFEGPGELSIFPEYGRVVPGSTGDIQWHKSFPGGLVIVVTLQGLVPGHKYILSINGDPQRAGNGHLTDIYRVSRDSTRRYYDFSTITTDVTGSYHATFGIMLPKDQYDVSFYVKETTDFSIGLYHDFFQFTVE